METFKRERALIKDIKLKKGDILNMNIKEYMEFMNFQ